MRDRRVLLALLACVFAVPLWIDLATSAARSPVRGSARAARLPSGLTPGGGFHSILVLGLAVAGRERRRLHAWLDELSSGTEPA